MANLLGVSKVTVYRIVNSRKIPFYKINGGLRFAENDILEYLKQNRIESVA